MRLNRLFLLGFLLVAASLAIGCTNLGRMPVIEVPEHFPPSPTAPGPVAGGSLQEEPDAYPDETEAESLDLDTPEAVGQVQELLSGLAGAMETPQPTVTPTPIPTATQEPTLTPSPTPVPCESPGYIAYGSFESRLVGVYPYRIYLPPCYGEDRRTYPTLYMLPGLGHTDGIWDALAIDETIEQFINDRELAPMIIAMPYGGTSAHYTSGGPGSYEEVIMEDFIPFIEENYCVWQAREGRAIGGMSRGGYWSLEIAFSNPEHFSSVGGHSAYLLDYYAGEDVNPQHTGLANDLQGMRIYLDFGEYDLGIFNTQKLHEDLDEAGIENTWIVNDGGYHIDPYWGDHVHEYLLWYGEPWPLDPNIYPECDIDTE